MNSTGLATGRPRHFRRQRQLFTVGERFELLGASAEQQLLQLCQVEFQPFDARLALGQGGLQRTIFFGESGGIHGCHDTR
ncbi:hypothetical protein [Methylococcus sp. Mc7]|uniref:hypothetical protein n=1 Tax=Methylococcus sp. Mc7 TaxID=2860258 RepID=UPI002104888D|nr:hypothetical protein [Methylococcus sp. Mc7]